MKSSRALWIVGLLLAFVAACSVSGNGGSSDDDDDTAGDDTDGDNGPAGGVDLSGNWDCWSISENISPMVWTHSENPQSFDGCLVYGNGMICPDDTDASGLDVSGPVHLEGDVLTMIGGDEETTDLTHCTRID